MLLRRALRQARMKAKEPQVEANPGEFGRTLSVPPLLT